VSVTASAGRCRHSRHLRRPAHRQGRHPSHRRHRRRPLRQRRQWFAPSSAGSPSRRTNRKSGGCGSSLGSGRCRLFAAVTGRPWGIRGEVSTATASALVSELRVVVCKSVAKASKVRILHLPHAAKTACDQRKRWAQAVFHCPAISGHIRGFTGLRGSTRGNFGVPDLLDTSEDGLNAEFRSTLLPVKTAGVDPRSRVRRPGLPRIQSGGGMKALLLVDRPCLLTRHPRQQGPRIDP
jgi:hypothetical protein